MVGATPLEILCLRLKGFLRQVGHGRSTIYSVERVLLERHSA